MLARLVERKEIQWRSRESQGPQTPVRHPRLKNDRHQTDAPSRQTRANQLAILVPGAVNMIRNPFRIGHRKLRYYHERKLRENRAKSFYRQSDDGIAPRRK